MADEDWTLAFDERFSGYYRTNGFQRTRPYIGPEAATRAVERGDLITVAEYDDMLAWRPGEYPVVSGEKPGTCRSCGAKIVWARAESGKAVPLSIVSIRTDSQGKKYAISHFTDCPDAKGWSGHGRASQGKAREKAA